MNVQLKVFCLWENVCTVFHSIEFLQECVKKYSILLMKLHQITNFVSMKKKKEAMNLINDLKMCKCNMLEELEAFKNSQKKSSKT